MWYMILCSALFIVLIAALLSGSRPPAAPQEESAREKVRMQIVPGSAQHIGEREEQQDAYCFSELDESEAVRKYGVLAVLADGMGGLAMGGEASHLAVQSMLRAYTMKADEEDIPQALERAIRMANRAVYELAMKHELEWGVGTTLTAVVVSEGRLYWTSAGDSRIYLYREGTLSALTKDHIYARRLDELVKAGHMTREEADSHPDRQLLTSYLGIPELQEIDSHATPYRLQPEDWILLCSDGLYEGLTEQVMYEAAKLPPQLAAEFIVRQVIAEGRPYQDNATIVIVNYRVSVHKTQPFDASTRRGK
ncbi:PP2C family protein-serine/threonine phosphatase [Paenibacillus harenae]|uniref:PP2C family protein-serine/threonine phosphatase n=1 Tax=Paenibacillus harenae TaxID=306543 RepID=UPI0027D8242E|nr:protein phosphatase 2C domain-containing protein [Paenibacillus harenae]